MQGRVAADDIQRLAHLDAKDVRFVLAVLLTQHHRLGGDREDAIAETRRHGLSRTLGQPIPGINAFCAPVFDAAGHLVLGITVMGPEATFDNEWDGRVARPLRECALEVSRRLGYLEAA